MPISTIHIGKLRNTISYGKIPKKLLRGLKNIDSNGKKGNSKQERMFGAVSKIPIANAFNELVEMDCVDYGDYVTFLHIHDTLSRFSVVVFTGPRKRVCKRRKWPAKRRFRIG